jgi:molybdate transport repressor ModE-like protein
MMDSLLLGLDSIADSCERVFISPVDVPVVKVETVRELAEISGQFVRPIYDGVAGHPVLLDTSVVPMVREYSDLGLQRAIEKCGITATDVDVVDEGVLMESNTTEEYSKILKYQHRTTGKSQPIKLELKLALCADERFFTSDTAKLFELIETTGSLESASAAMHISYSDGQNIIKLIKDQLGVEIIENTNTGCRLTDDGKQLLSKFQQMISEISKDSADIFNKYFSGGNLHG